MTGIGGDTDPLRRHLDWMERHVEDTHWEEQMFAAVRAVLDLCDVEDRAAVMAEERAYLFVTEVRAAIAEALGVSSS